MPTDEQIGVLMKEIRKEVWRRESAEKKLQAAWRTNLGLREKLRASADRCVAYRRALAADRGLDAPTLALVAFGSACLGALLGWVLL